MLQGMYFGAMLWSQLCTTSCSVMAHMMVTVLVKLICRIVLMTKLGMLMPQSSGWFCVSDKVISLVPMRSLCMCIHWSCLSVHKFLKLLNFTVKLKLLNFSSSRKYLRTRYSVERDFSIEVRQKTEFHDQSYKSQEMYCIFRWHYCFI